MSEILTADDSGRETAHEEMCGMAELRAERVALRARLAEVERERDEARWRSGGFQVGIDAALARAENAERCLHDVGECCTACGDDANRQILVKHDLMRERDAAVDALNARCSESGRDCLAVAFQARRVETAEAALAGYEHTSGNLCPACGWRGIRGDDGCAFCAFDVAGKPPADDEVLRLRMACLREQENTSDVEKHLAACEEERDGLSFALRQPCSDDGTDCTAVAFMERERDAAIARAEEAERRLAKEHRNEP